METSAREEASAELEPNSARISGVRRRSSFVQAVSAMFSNLFPDRENSVDSVPESKGSRSLSFRNRISWKANGSKEDGKEGSKDESSEAIVTSGDLDAPPKPIKKRVSSKRFRITREKSQHFEITEEMICIQKILCDPKARQKTIETLVPLDSSASVVMRFCCAVEEYQMEKVKKTKAAKAAKIVKLFIRKGSRFRISNIPEQYETSLKAKKYECLDILKTIQLEELTHNEVVMKIVNDVLASMGQNDKI